MAQLPDGWESNDQFDLIESETFREQNLDVDLWENKEDKSYYVILIGPSYLLSRGIVSDPKRAQDPFMVAWTGPNGDLDQAKYLWGSYAEHYSSLSNTPAGEGDRAIELDGMYEPEKKRPKTLPTLLSFLRDEREIFVEPPRISFFAPLAIPEEDNWTLNPDVEVKIVPFEPFRRRQVLMTDCVRVKFLAVSNSGDTRPLEYEMKILSDDDKTLKEIATLVRTVLLSWKPFIRRGKSETDSQREDAVIFDFGFDVLETGSLFPSSFLTALDSLFKLPIFSLSRPLFIQSTWISNYFMSNYYAVNKDRAKIPQYGNWKNRRSKRSRPDESDSEDDSDELDLKYMRTEAQLAAALETTKGDVHAAFALLSIH